MMLIQSSLPISIEAALSFVSDHGKQDFLCDWMPGAETWQKCSKCDKHPRSGCGKAVPVAEAEKTDVELCSLNFPRSRSQLSTVSIMSQSSGPTIVYQRKNLQRNSVTVCPAQVSESPAPTIVYQRKNLQRNSVTVCPAQASANTKPSDGCLSAISSVAAKEHTVSPVEVEAEAVRAPVMLPVECSSGAFVLKSESFNGCSVGDDPGSEEATRSEMHKEFDLCFINDSCSSSESNMDLSSASLKTEVDDTGECSSSGALVTEGLWDDMLEKDICISILRSHGLLEGFSSIRAHASVAHTGMNSDSYCSRSCKVCDQSEATLKMLICDHCEEAFHVSCCYPRIKKIPVDEWFCDSCLKKKRKILKEKTTNKSLNIGSETGSYRKATCKGELGPIAFMLKYSEPYTTGVRIGKEFQAAVPDWSGPIVDEVYPICEPVERNPSEGVTLHDWSSNKPSRVSSIGNWLQCREVIEGVGEGIDGTICGKWRRAPLFEVQTDDWECFSSVLWDPAHADCAVPQELETEEVLKHLKYIEMLRPRLAAKRRKLGQTESVGS